MKTKSKKVAAAPQSANEELDQAIGMMAGRLNATTEDARWAFINACESFARNLTEAANAAKREEHRYVSTTVMSSSLVQTITKEAQRYDDAINALQQLGAAHSFATRKRS